MPTYEYACAACGKDFELFQSIKDDPIKTCPLCGKTGEVRRKIGRGAGIIFKGSGFYETDYKRKSDSGSAASSPSSSSSSASTSASSSSSGSTPAPKTESKPSSPPPSSS
ncbi:MAG TPA: zinc ribbon domain-containing protein [Opitutaceae bacterium]|nr:zinc ribbon domain-containing protein [Opitutaceae bacterium]